MHFTREPLVETIIAPKEGFKLLVRSSRESAPEEFYVESVQVVMIGSHCFYRALEKPKPFLLPASDYEIIEVREARLSVKLPSKEAGGIKIAGGRETSLKASAPSPREEEEEARVAEEETALPQEPETASDEASASQEKQGRNRRFRGKRRKGEEQRTQAPAAREAEKGMAPSREEKPVQQLIPPPPTLISETISRYKDLPDFAGAFFEKEAEEKVEEAVTVQPSPASEEESAPPPSEEKPLPSPREEAEEPDFLNP